MQNHISNIVGPDRIPNPGGLGAWSLTQTVSLHRPRMAIRAGLVLIALALNLSLAQHSCAVSFTSTGSLTTSCAGHAAILLSNGKVLVFGGYNGSGPGRLANASLYNPAAGSWTATGPLNLGRTTATATLLSNGLALASGGHDSGSTSTASTELYNPITGTWTYTGSMGTPRGSHTATLLANGHVLVVGGRNRAGAYEVSAAERYNPATGAWTDAGALATARDTHTATLLFDGKVLVAAGSPDGLQYTSLASAELYDPVAETWTATGSLITPRQAHTATLLPDGRVLVAGGFKDGYFLDTAELYDPATGTWTATGSLGTARGVHTASLLPDGKVLVAGGNHNTFSVPQILTQSSAEVYDSAAGTWTPTSSLLAARTTQTATLLPSGRVLIVGGYNYNGNFWLSSAELYGSSPGPIILTKRPNQAGGAFEFSFTGAASSTNIAVAATNPELPLAAWTELGVVPEFSPGLFLFSDLQATNSPLRFYRLRSP